MEKCNFCTQSYKDDECPWKLPIRAIYCKKAIKQMVKVLKKQNKGSIE